MNRCANYICVHVCEQSVTLRGCARARAQKNEVEKEMMRGNDNM